VSLTVVVADDDYLIREGISRILDSAPDITVTAACGDGEELLAAIGREQPDVVVTDIRMPPSGGDEGIRIANGLRRTHPRVGVLVLSQFVEPEYAIALLDEGSDRRGYLLKDRIRDRNAIIGAVRELATGGSAFDAKVVEGLVSSHTGAPTSPLHALSARELEVLGEVAQGKSNAAVAESLVLTKSAVEKHINSIFSKLNLAGTQEVSQRVKAVLLFLDRGGH
jgi:DNA-binding NarL/FixJ family response regulator